MCSDVGVWYPQSETKEGNPKSSVQKNNGLEKLDRTYTGNTAPGAYTVIEKRKGDVRNRRE